MQYTRLGSTGATVSRVCLGMMSFGAKQWQPWVLEEEDARPLIKRAIELGFTFFDTADVYSRGVSEEITGRALKDFGPPRDQIVLATKVNGAMGEDPNQRGLSRKHIMRAIDNSLRRLGTDYVDLYQIHRFDPATPIEETLEALNDVVRAGKALYIGASSMWAWQFAQMLATSDARGWSRFVTMQDHYNLIYREEEREMLPLCRKEGIGVIPWSPLARGVLARLRADAEATERARTDIFGPRRYEHDEQWRHRRRGERHRHQTRRHQRPGGACLGDGAARGDRTDRRRDQNESPRGRRQGAGDHLRRGGDQGADGTVPAAGDRRSPVAFVALRVRSRRGTR